MNDAHLHLLVNHLPIVGALFALPLHAVALLRRGDRGWLGAALLSTVLVGAAAPIAMVTGEPAEEAVEDLPDVAGPAIHEHEERAELATGLAVVVAIASVGAGLVATRRELPLIAQAGLLGGALVVAGAMAAVGASGGPIRHSEIRDGAAAGREGGEGAEAGEAEEREEHERGEHE